MDDGWNAFYTFMLGAVISGILFGTLVQSRVMQQALDRGYAVQCVGKSGIYWECE